MDFQWQLRGKVFPFLPLTVATEWVICVLPNCRWYKNNIYGFIAFYKFATAFFSQAFFAKRRNSRKNFLLVQLNKGVFKSNFLRYLADWPEKSFIVNFHRI